jgi:DNA mismatch endonuclease, patch repair protein
LTDNLSNEQRRHAMRRVKSKNTSPELLVRRLLRKLGYTGYRLHRADIVGKPDIVWIGRKRALFINGCFWHGHDCSRGSRKPKTRAEYWDSKIERNRQRDAHNRLKLETAGWCTLTLWECQLRDEESLAAILQSFLA